MKLSELGTDTADRARLLAVTEKQVELGGAANALAEAVGELLVEMREKEGLCQADLAGMLGLPANRISQFESGQLRHAVDLKSLAKIAASLGYDLKIQATKAET